MPKLFVAFAAADLMTFATGVAAALLTLARIPNASLTFLPRTKSMTSLALRGVTRTFLALAYASVGITFFGF